MAVAFTLSKKALFFHQVGQKELCPHTTQSAVRNFQHISYVLCTVQYSMEVVWQGNKYML